MLHMQRSPFQTWKQQSATNPRLCLYDIMSYASVGPLKANGALLHTHLLESNFMTDPYSLLAPFKHLIYPYLSEYNILDI